MNHFMVPLFVGHSILVKIFENKVKSIYRQSEKFYLDSNVKPKIQILNSLY